MDIRGVEYHGAAMSSENNLGLWTKWRRRKETYAKHLMKTRNAFYSPGGKSLDICILYNYEDIVIFDIPRCKEDYLNYGKFKNGIIQSGKYEPVLKIVEYVEVIVMVSFLPKEGIFSEDRIKLVPC